MNTATKTRPTLTPAERRAKRALAHSLEPVVSVGQHGLTPSVLREINVALKAHELVKIRVHSDDRQARNAWMAEICEAAGCAPVQHLGKVLIVYRPRPAEPVQAPARPPRGRPASPGERRRGAQGARVAQEPARATSQGQARGGKPAPRSGAAKGGFGEASRWGHGPGAAKAGAARAGTARAGSAKPGTASGYLSRRGAGRMVAATTGEPAPPPKRRRARS